MNKLTERLNEAEKARQRWLTACENGTTHGTVNRYWESYVKLAQLAGVAPDGRPVEGA